MTDRDAAVIVEELRRLVAWPTQNVAASASGLRALARRRKGISETSSDRAVFVAVLRILADTIEALDGPVTVLLPSGRSIAVAAAKAKRAYLLLFWLGRADRRPSHELRRGWAIEELGLDMTVSHWRRDGPESAFLSILAAHLLSDSTEPPRWVHEAFDLTYGFDDRGHLYEHHVSARLRAAVRQEPASEMTLVTDSYPGHRFDLVHLFGGENIGPVASHEGLPLQVTARGPAVQVGDALNVSAAFSVASASTINRVVWFMGASAETASVRLQFHPRTVPRTIWRFSNAASPEEGMIAGEQVVELLGAGCYQQFDEPARDRWFGLFWSWS